jgi:hypothetical protein
MKTPALVTLGRAAKWPAAALSERRGHPQSINQRMGPGTDMPVRAIKSPLQPGQRARAGKSDTPFLSEERPEPYDLSDRCSPLLRSVYAGRADYAA